MNTLRVTGMVAGAERQQVRIKKGEFTVFHTFSVSPTGLPGPSFPSPKSPKSFPLMTSAPAPPWAGVHGLTGIFSSESLSVRRLRHRPTPGPGPGDRCRQAPVHPSTVIQIGAGFRGRGSRAERIFLLGITQNQEVEE